MDGAEQAAEALTADLLPPSLWGRLAALRPAQIAHIRDNAPIAYVPWGALEWHAPHNPVGLDGLKAEALCLALAQRTGGVVIPTLYLGADTIKPFKGFGETLDYTREVVRAVCAQTLTQLVEEGFRLVVLVTGHLAQDHLRALQAGRADAEAIVSGGADTPPARGRATLWLLDEAELLAGRWQPDHAARVETSWQLLFAPDLVDLAALPADRPLTLDRDGVWGEDPRAATAEQGRAMLARLLAAAVPRIQRLAREARATAGEDGVELG